MGEAFTLTRDMMLSARTYLPLTEKMTFVSENAPKCFDRLQISAGDEAMPPMYMENTALKSRYLMFALLTKYLHLLVNVEIENKKPSELLTEEDYDYYAGGHVFSQIERFKSDATLRDRCFDLLGDYRDLERRMNAQIAGLLAVQNDPVMRQSMLMRADMMALPGLMDELKKLGEQKDGA